VALLLAGVALILLVEPIIEWLSDDRTPPPLVQFVGASLFFAGIACGAGGVALIVVEIFGESASAAAVRAGALLLGTTALVLSALTVLRRFPPAKPSAPSTPTWPSDSLANLASRSLEEIRYQQTYAHGWSGTLSLPVGLGAGVTTDTTLARYAMTYPEVVARLRNLLTLAAARYDVLIVIDELDKLESGEKADRFLNELKAVFGVPGTYFLVSVSEDAMSRFERRGLSFRDVFDSTFDEIVRVRPLSLGESQTLLGKRVVGLPLIYSALCHVMSGGLPRDLIRTARRLVEIHERDDEPDELEMLTRTLLADELQSKTEAMRYAARADAPVEPLLTWFLDWLKEYGETPTDAAPLIARCQVIQELATVKLPLASAVDPDARAARSTLLRMGLELGAYAYFAATVLEVFRNDLSEDEIALAADGARDAPYLDALARAHAGFVVNAKTAWLGVTQFRTGRALHPILELSQPAIT
jgi:hypothetical protein